MSTPDNLSNAVASGKVKFTSYYDLDKIPFDGETSATLAGVGAGDPTSPVIQVVRIVNPYGAKCFTSGTFSVDGTNWYDTNSSINYFNAGFSVYTASMAVEIGCDASYIYVVCFNGFTGTQTVTVRFSIDTP